MAPLAGGAIAFYPARGGEFVAPGCTNSAHNSFVSALDGLSVIEDLLGLARVQACKPPFVPRAQPGPCPKSQKRAWNTKRLNRKAIAKPKAAAGGSKAYTGPRFEMPAGKQAQWDSAVRDAVRSKSVDPAMSQDERGAAKQAADEFRGTLTEVQARRFDQEASIAAGQDDWRRKSPQESRDTPEQMQAKMADALKEQWGGKKIAVRITSDGLEQVLRTGRFKTVHETYKTKGFNNGKTRGELEEQAFGIDPGGDKTKMPVYGYVAVNGVRRPSLDSALGQYGPIQVVLKDAVRGRTTASNGDSIGQRSAVRPSPVDAPEHWSYAVAGQPPGDYDIDSERLMNRSYAEAQIHGGVAAEDIDEVVFSRQPEDRVVRRLEDRGIPWRIVE